MKGIAGKHQEDLTASEMILLLKVTHAFCLFCPVTWTKLTVPKMLLVHDASTDRVRPHHHRSKSFHSTLISLNISHRQL